MTSWVGFGHVLEDLRAEGSPAQVVELAERAVEDEYRHALWCRDWAQRFGHSEPVEVRPRTEVPVTFRGATENENRLLRIAFCCLTETFGCFVLRHARSFIHDAELRSLNRRHLADELRHSRVGWGHLAVIDERQKVFLSRWTPQLLRSLLAVCRQGSEEEREDLVPFGYFTPALLRRAHDEAVAEVILPGLEHLGIGRA
jgi:hypothetical protein